VRWALLLLCGLCYGQPKVGLIDFYGQRKVSEERLLKAMGIREGSALPATKVSLEEKLEEVDNVVRAHIEASCCHLGGAIIYAGVEERGANGFQFRLTQEERELSSPGSQDVEGLLAAVRAAADASIRANSAVWLGDRPPAQSIIDALQWAAQDLDPLVRKAAVRGLVRMAKAVPFADPELKLQVLPTWILAMLHSVIWTDRVNAVDALLELTAAPNPLLIDRIRETGFESLTQMAKWRHLPHALPPFLLLCRAAGLSDAEAQSAWAAGDRDKVFARIVKENKKR
jgi:hypothetical protein